MQKKNFSSLIMFTGFVLLGLALAFLLLGNNLFDNNGQATKLGSDQVPAFGEDVNTDLPVVSGNGRLPEVGETIYEFAAQDLDGHTIRLSDYRGKPVMVNFWATWCPPCRMELPDFQQAYTAHQDDGLVILAVNQDEPDDVVRSYFYEENGFTFTPVLDTGSQISRAYGVYSFPTTVFVNPDGVVTAVHQGLLFPELLDVYLAQTIPSQS